MGTIFEFKKILEIESNDFLERIRLCNDPWYKNLKHKGAVFPVLHPDDSCHYELKHQEQLLEWNIRLYLVNNVLIKLFELHGMHCTPFDEKAHIAKCHESIAYTCHHDNSVFESIYPFEFLLDKEGKTIGFRHLWIGDQKAKEEMKKYGVDNTIQIDWTDGFSDNEHTVQKFWDDIQNNSVSRLSIKELFIVFFSNTEYDIYLERVRDIIAEAYSIIGLHTVPRVSSRYISEFKLSIAKELEDGYKHLDLQYIFKDGSKIDLLSSLSTPDQKALENRLWEQKLYQSLAGNEDFAVCFFTSEHLYRVFGIESNNNHRFFFDYTAVITGYLKSVEQLVFKISLSMLERDHENTIWMKRKYARKFPRYVKEAARKNPETGTNQIPFEKKYSSYFDTSLASLLWCLHDDLQEWYISSNGIEIIHDLIIHYSQECRNEHFHKDNIYYFSEVERIRNNTIVCLFSLLGCCKISDDIVKDEHILGMVDDSYDRLYKEIAKLSISRKNFLLAFQDGKEIKAIRLQQQEPAKYDELGYILSEIRFVKVESYDIGNYQFFLKHYPRENEIVVSRENKPSSVAYFSRGKLVYIDSHDTKQDDKG